MSGFTNPIVGGGGALVYPSIHSPNFEAGVQGWTINKDGTAEFSDLTVRGEIVIENPPDGVFVYGFQPE
jgi:hypothetical protein